MKCTTVVFPLSKLTTRLFLWVLLTFSTCPVWPFVLAYTFCPTNASNFSCASFKNASFIRVTLSSTPAECIWSSSESLVDSSPPVGTCAFCSASCISCWLATSEWIWYATSPLLPDPRVTVALTPAFFSTCARSPSQ